MKNKLIIIVFTLLFLLSVIFNIILYNNLNKYKHGVDVALDHYVTEYNVGSIHRALTYSITEGKLKVGEADNLHERDFRYLSDVHRNLTLLYGPISTYENVDISTNNLFSMYQDFSVFFDHLLINNADLVVNETEGQYIYLHDLDEATRTGVQMISEITGDLEAIRSRSYKDRQSSSQEALEEFMVKSAAYYKSQEVQEKVDMLQTIIRTMISESSK